MVERTRRRTLGTLASLAAVGVAGCLGGGNDDIEEETYGDWFSNVGNFDGTEDHTGEDEVEVGVGTEGGLAYTPPAVRVDTGTTVVWEWTGEGGQHDVREEDGTFESELTAEEGFVFEHTFDDPGVYRYVCTPHQTSGMKGAVHVVE